MATKIEWCTESWNPVVGCSKCSPGCDHCYAERMANRLAGMGIEPYIGVVADGKWNGLTNKAPAHIWEQPFSWKKPRRIFVCSMSDVFHPSVKPENHYSLFRIIKATPRHTYIVLTKRVDAMRRYFDKNPENLLSNVWAGVTVCTQKEAEEKIPELCEIPAKIRFVSIEPMLEEMDILRYLKMGVNWVILGGESGPGARGMRARWAIEVKMDCDDAGVPLFFKQWGSWKGSCDFRRLYGYDPNAHKGGNILCGKKYEQYPEIANTNT